MKTFYFNCSILSLAAFTVLSLNAQNIKNNPTSNHGNKFEQLGTILQSPNSYRTASGAPGHDYWQQRADYKINAILDEKELRLNGEEEVTYYNNSPDVLSYLWLQLDENEHSVKSDANNFDGNQKNLPLTTGQLDNLDFRKELEGYG